MNLGGVGGKLPELLNGLSQSPPDKLSKGIPEGLLWKPSGMLLKKSPCRFDCAFQGRGSIPIGTSLPSQLETC